MPRPGRRRGFQDRRKIQRARAHFLERLACDLPFLVHYRRAFRLVLQMHQRNPAGILLQHLNRILACQAHPKHIQLQPDRLPVQPRQQNIDRPLARRASKFESVVVIAELQSRGARLRPGAIHLVGKLLVRLRIAALFRPHIRHHDVLAAR